VTAVSTLALGIGLSVAVFAVAEALLLRKLPYRDQDRLVVLWGQLADRSAAAWPLELTRAREFARGSRSFERAAFFAYEGAWPQPFRDGDRMTRLRQALVSGEFFAVLDAAPFRGRALRQGDDIIGAAPVVVLSHGAWQRHFGVSDDAVGRQIVLHGNGKAYTIVGVMPLGFGYPVGTDYWAPLVPGRARPGPTQGSPPRSTTSSCGSSPRTRTSGRPPRPTWPASFAAGTRAKSPWRPPARAMPTGWWTKGSTPSTGA
jgi:hypothetical protein